MAAATLDAFLNSHAGSGAVSGGVSRAAVAETVRALAGAAVRVRDAINLAAVNAAADGREPGSRDADDEGRRDLDSLAGDTFLEAVRRAPVAACALQEMRQPVALDASAPLAISIDPLDGSANVEANIAIGTIFGILPADGAPGEDPAAAFLQPGSRLLAAGFFIYGPQLALVLSLGSGTHVFAFSARLGSFVQSHESRIVPPRTSEFSINAANYRHWDEAVRLYVDDCLKGAEGPRERDFNMRWIASLVADAYRILMRGGVFLYPADRRKDYGSGRLRLVHQASPLAFLIEQAGGAATDMVGRILDLTPQALSQRVPVCFGSRKEVERVARYHTEPSAIGERHPLFGNRGLFRA